MTVWHSISCITCVRSKAAVEHERGGERSDERSGCTYLRRNFRKLKIYPLLVFM